MTRSSSRRVAEPPQDGHVVTRAGTSNVKEGQSGPITKNGKKDLSDVQDSIIRNWKLGTGKTMGINKCVIPDHWPQNSSDADLWPGEVMMLLLQASEISKGNNQLFQKLLGKVVKERQERNTSAKGKTPCMMAPDLKKVCQRLEELVKDGKDAKQEPERQDAGKRPERRGRSNGKPLSAPEQQSAKATDQDKPEQKPNSKRTTRNSKLNGQTTASTVPEPVQSVDDKKASVSKGRGQPKDLNNEPSIPKPAPKRTASDLPLRPARKPRIPKSPKTKSTVPPPFTPANPPSPSDSEAESDEAPVPPEPVSGRHIYGAYIPPTLISFNAADPTTTQSGTQTQTRQTRSRKRGRAEDEQEGKPTQVQIDSDPRDIDATGFLSELDPKEAQQQQRRKRKVRLSRLGDEPVAEPAWSQDLPPNPGQDEGELGLSGAGMTKLVSPAPARDGVGGEGRSAENSQMAMEMLMQLLPAIPLHATEEERSVLEDRIALLGRDVVAYQTAVWDIEKRVEGGEGE